MASAFESITTRQAWYGAAALDKYIAVEIGTAGKYVKATGARPFAGIVEYGCEDADQMVTVVRGTYPGFAAAEIGAGALVCIDGTGAATYGTFKVCAAGVAIGVALTEATAAGETFTVQMLETPFTVS